MPHRNKLAYILIIVSLACLYPGLTQPMLNIHAGAQIPLLGELVLYDQTQSIVQTISSLFQNDNSIVGILILFFSIIIPLLKAAILLLVLSFKQWTGRKLLYQLVAVIGKWSMADVFVVGVFISFLATKSDAHINAVLHPGFFYFTAYCVISIIGIQMVDPTSINSPTTSSSISNN